NVGFGKFVVGISRQEVREQRLRDGRQGAQRFEVPGSTAIAYRLQALDTRDRLVGNQHVAEFAPESHAALHHIAIHDDTATQAGADYGGDGRGVAVRPEDGEVAPERSSVAIVEINHRFLQFLREAAGDIESRPSGVHEVRGSAGAEYSFGT